MYTIIRYRKPPAPGKPVIEQLCRDGAFKPWPLANANDSMPPCETHAIAIDYFTECAHRYLPTNQEYYYRVENAVSGEGHAVNWLEISRAIFGELTHE